MKKINWFRRIFLSWDKIEKFVLENYKGDGSQHELVDFIKDTNKNLLRDKENLISKVNELENKYKTILTINDEKEKSLSSKEAQISSLEKMISETKATLQEKTGSTQKIQEEINKKLSTLGKIESTFFASAGNKGKGELGEMQVKTILEKSGLLKDFWIENLSVGSKVVEFAIKSGEENRWIPIDSKVLDPLVDENGKIIIDKIYIQRINAQAKNISQYLGKENTAGYGVLVIQSDAILMELYENFPGYFKEVLRDHKVYIASPSSFVQMAWSISQIVDIYDRVKGDEAIYKDMMSTLDAVARFARSLKESQSKLNIAMDTHFPAIENKHKKLAKRLDKTGKLKEITKELNNG